MNEKTEEKNISETVAAKKRFSERSLTYKPSYELPEVLKKVGIYDLVIYLKGKPSNCQIWSANKKIFKKVFELIRAYNKQTFIGTMEVGLPKEDWQRLAKLISEIRQCPSSSIGRTSEKQISNDLEIYSAVILETDNKYVISSTDDQALKIILDHLIKNKNWKLIRGSIDVQFSYEDNWDDIKKILGTIRIRKTLAPS